MNESEKFLQTSLENVKSLVDVNKSIGTPIKIEEGKVIIPLTEVRVTFLAGGSEFGKLDKQNYPFGGLTGGNIIMKPCGFITLEDNQINVIELKQKSALESILLEDIPMLIGKLKKEKRTD